jgi:hypothetical protein
MTHLKKEFLEYPPSAHPKNSRLVRSGVMAFTYFNTSPPLVQVNWLLLLKRA